MGKIADSLGTYLSKGSQFAARHGKVWFKNYLTGKFRQVFAQASIKYALIFTGIALVIFEPISFFFSHLTASLLFLGVLVWSAVSMIRIVVNYHRLPYYIISGKSIKEGAYDFINYKWPKATIGIAGYNLIKLVGSMFSDKFNEMPDIDETVNDFIHFVLKDIIIFAIFFSLYFITVNLFLKPFLLMNYAGIHTWEIYLFPFVQIINFTKSLL